MKAKLPPRYTNADLQEALKAANSGQPLATVAKQFNIPKSTLFAKKNGLSDPIIKRRGPECILGEANEQKLVEWIFQMSEHGFPITKPQLMERVQILLKEVKKNSPFSKKGPGRHWFEAFLKRHPELTARLALNTHLTQATVSEQDVRDWFEKIKSYLTIKNLIDIDATRVFNSCEFGFHLLPRGQRVLANRESKSTYNFIKNDEKECVTAQLCGNAAGQMVPPMVSFNYVRLPNNIRSLMPQGWGIGVSDKGWMTPAGFYTWMTDIFYPWLIENKIEMPVVLYLDGQSSYLTLEVSNFGREKGIEVIALHPNSTTFCQPFDVAVYHPIKDSWREQVTNWRLANSGDRLSRESFGGILKKVIDSLDWEAIFKNGFRATGLYPFSVDGIDFEKHFPSTTYQQTHSLDPEIVPQLGYLEFVEQNIDDELLAAFKLVKDEESWTGDICHKSLFEFWRKVRHLEVFHEFATT